MKLVIGLCIIVFIELIILCYLSMRKRKNKDEKKDKGNKENFENPYKIVPLTNSELTTCQRCIPKGDIYNGYQVAPQPPSSYWYHTNTNLDQPSTSSNFQQYARLEMPQESAQYGQCNDAYRCRKYGVATGVQGKIF